jgi:anaerobic ribonucleoside-triphosphate reductase activating protein
MNSRAILTINLSDALDNFPISRFNGPGLRYCLWVQGCSIRCTDVCINPDQLQHVERVRLPVGAVADYVFALQDKWAIEGVTYLGGEPFDQADALAALGHLVKTRGLTVVTYTGRTLDALLAEKRMDWQRLLSVTDILIDGPFLKDRASNQLRWRGSSNQRIIFLTQAYNEATVLSRPFEKGANFILGPDGTLKISGLQEKHIADALVTTLTERGIIE